MSKLVAKSFEASHDGVPRFLSENPPPSETTKADVLADVLAEVLAERDRYKSVLLTIAEASLNRKNPKESWDLIHRLVQAALEVR